MKILYRIPLFKPHPSTQCTLPGWSMLGLTGWKDLTKCVSWSLESNANLPYQTNSWQTEQNVGCGKKVAVNSWHLTWWTLACLMAPRRWCKAKKPSVSNSLMSFVSVGTGQGTKWVEGMGRGGKDGDRQVIRQALKPVKSQALIKVGIALSFFL